MQPVDPTGNARTTMNTMTEWARAHFGAGVNVVLGFQAPASHAGATVLLPPKPAAAPRLSWLDRLDRWFWRQEQRRIEAYFSTASDLAELEQRMNRLERAGRSGFL